MLQANIKEFGNLLDFRKWVNHKFETLSYLNDSAKKRFTRRYVEQTIKDVPHHYGGTTFDEMEAGLTAYKSPDLIERVLNKVKGQVVMNAQTPIKGRRIDYNATGLGVFVFDRAAMGLYRLREYYSISHNKIVDFSEVGKEGSEFVLRADGSPVAERWEENADGKPKVRTNNKKVFAWFPPKFRERPAVDLYVGCGALGGVQADELLYSGISAVVVAQILEQAKIRTKVVAALGVSPESDFSKNVYASFITVKNYDQPLDRNLIALVSSDARFHRHEGFKSYLCLYDEFQTKSPDDYGYGIGKTELTKIVENSTYKLDESANKIRYYFGRVFDEEQIVKDIKSTLEDIATKTN